MTPDFQVIQGLWLGDNTDPIFEGQCDVVLQMGLSIRVDPGIRHRTAAENTTERGEAMWVEQHWFEGRKVIVRANPLDRGSRVIARVLLNLGSEEKEAVKLLAAVHSRSGDGG